MSALPEIRLHWWHFPPYVISAASADASLSPEGAEPFLQNMSGALPFVLRHVFIICGLIGPNDRPMGSMTTSQVNNQLQFDNLAPSSSSLDLLLPFSSDGSVLAADVDGFRMPFEFVPILSSPGAVHFYRAREQPVGSDLVTVILQGWPMLVFILLGAGYSGIIIWLLDRLWNPSNFPKPFIRGFWEGFWWAFVTMTTVGYGDTTPRSFQARMFGLVWIVVGITILSVFTATVTTVLTQESLGVHYTIPGNEVGVVNGTEDYKLVIKQGGKPAVAGDFDDLIEVARSGKTHSAVYDQYGFVYEQNKLGDDFVVETIIENPVIHGVMIVGPQSNTKTCLVTALKQDRRQAFRKMASFIKPLSQRTIRSQESTQNLFQPKTIRYIWYGLAFWVFLFVCFVLWEFLYWRPKHKRRKEMKRHLNLKHGWLPPDSVSMTSDSEVSCFPKRPRYSRDQRSLVSNKLTNSKQAARAYVRPQIYPQPGPPPLPTTQDSAVERSSMKFNNRTRELIEVGNLDTLIRKQKEELDDLDAEMSKFKADWENKLKQLKRHHREERRKLLRLMDHEDNIRNETKTDAGHSNQAKSTNLALSNANKATCSHYDNNWRF